MEKSGRKTRWDLIAGSVGDGMVLVNSSFHRRISETLLTSKELNPFGSLRSLRPEIRIGRSRLDYLMIDGSGKELYIEVKGCSLTRDGKALFPDAPTTRGNRHLRELIQIRKNGKRAGVLILVLGPIAGCFSPNFETDPVFSETFIEAVRSGVEVHSIQFVLKGRELTYRGQIPICEDILIDQRGDKIADPI
jgi:sugar fermentation stimulation protein A